MQIDRTRLSWRLLSLMFLGVLTAGCGGIQSALYGTPTPVPSPTPPTVVGPAGVQVDCATGQVNGGSLADSLAVTYAAVSLPQPTIDYVFTLRFGGVDTISTPFYGALVFYDPAKPVIDPPVQDWYFDNVGNVVYGFVYQGGTSPDTFLATVNQNSWQESQATQFQAEVTGQDINIRIPAFEMPPGSQWGAVLSDGTLSICEAIGIGPDNLPSLEVPALP
jgi:hypothetical protein